MFTSHLKMQQLSKLHKIQQPISSVVPFFHRSIPYKSRLLKLSCPLFKIVHLQVALMQSQQNLLLDQFISHQQVSLKAKRKSKI